MKYQNSSGMKQRPVKDMKGGSGVMGNAGSVKPIMACEYPDMKRVNVQASPHRGYDQQAWNYSY